MQCNAMRRRRSISQPSSPRAMLCALMAPRDDKKGMLLCWRDGTLIMLACVVVSEVVDLPVFYFTVLEPWVAQDSAGIDAVSQVPGLSIVIPAGPTGCCMHSTSFTLHWHCLAVRASEADSLSVEQPMAVDSECSPLQQSSNLPSSGPKGVLLLNSFSTLTKAAGFLEFALRKEPPVSLHRPAEVKQQTSVCVCVCVLEVQLFDFNIHTAAASVGKKAYSFI